MGEKITSAADSSELLRVKALRVSLEGYTPPATAQSPDPALNSIAAPANGDTEVPFPVEKAYFEQIIENAPEAISIIDEEQRILRINGEFTRLFGYTAAEAAGRALDELIVPPDRYAETAWITQSILNIIVSLGLCHAT